MKQSHKPSITEKILNSKKQPIFVLGTARSGTSWCSNLLATHPQIAAVATAENENITGIHESHLFSHTRYCFPDKLTCQDFITRYREEDYFKLTGLSPGQFCKRHNGSFTVFELFRNLMDDYAEKQGTRYWLEKTPRHTIYYDDLIACFPDAVFIITRRSFRNTVLSNVNKYPRKGVSFARQVLEKVFRYVSDRRAIRRLKRRCPGRIIEVNYETLLENTQLEISRLLKFLQVTQIELSSVYPSNSAYGPGKRPKRRISTPGWAAIYLVRACFWLIPFPLVRYLRKRRDRQSAKRFPKFTFIPSPKEWQKT